MGAVFPIVMVRAALPVLLKASLEILVTAGIFTSVREVQAKKPPSPMFVTPGASMLVRVAQLKKAPPPILEISGASVTFPEAVGYATN